MENWDQLNLQEKANLIIFDNIIKLIELQDCESITGHKENEVHNVSSPSLLGREPSLLGRGPNTEDGGYSYPDDHLELQDGKNITGHKENEVHNISSPSLLGREPSLLGRGPNMENGGYSYLDDHLGIGQRHRPFRSTPTGPATYPVGGPDCSKI